MAADLIAFYSKNATRWSLHDDRHSFRLRHEPKNCINSKLLGHIFLNIKVKGLLVKNVMVFIFLFFFWDKSALVDILHSILLSAKRKVSFQKEINSASGHSLLWQALVPCLLTAEVISGLLTNSRLVWFTHSQDSSSLTMSRVPITIAW